MAIEGITQPLFIEIDTELRLRKFESKCNFALPWYQDEEIVWLVDGDKELYNIELLEDMYRYWNDAGELYFIEVLEGDNYLPIGDVTLCKDDLPIVIGDKNYWKKGIGTRVLMKVIERAKKLGFSKIQVEEIYSWNIASQKLFKKIGFLEVEYTKKGKSYELILDN